MEVTIRAIAAMRNIATHDESASQIAQAELQRLAQPSYTLAGRHAQRALQELMILEGERARELLLSLGARYGTGTNTGVGAPTPQHLEFTRDWTGSPEDFAKVRLLHDVNRISLIGAQFKDEVVTDLLAMQGVTDIDLYSTKISQAGLDELREKFHGVLDIRVGAKLGITAQDLPLQQCVIISVSPGSAAEKAGILPGDIVTVCDGQAVDSYPKLTSIIAEKAPGDTLELEVTRNRQKLSLAAVLDSW
jgi:hypothetical protein